MGSAGQNAVGPVVLVKRLRQDHLIAGVDQREQDHQHRLGAAAGDRDLGLRIDREPQVPGGVLGDGLPQVSRSPGNRILVHVVLDRATGGVLEYLGSGEIGHPLRQVDRVILQRLDRHTPNHALGESRGLR